MKIFSFLKKKEHGPLWSMQIHGEAICYNGEYIPDFLKKFDHLEDEVISLWNINELSWRDYQRMIIEVQEARQIFVRYVYN